MLELRHVGFETADNKEILHDVSLTVQERFVAVTGPNGGGKSTLAKVIAGIYQPTSGQILLDGVDITHMSITERANLGLSYAFQQPVRFKGLRVKDLLSLAAGKDTDVNQACSYLSEVGLCARDYVDRELNDSLSGGELKRIEIAMVLARGTKLSIFDEPEAGIDLWSFQNLIRVFEKMYEQTRGSILIISHQERILNIADKIVVIKNGQVEKVGARADILPAGVTSLPEDVLRLLKTKKLMLATAESCTGGMISEQITAVPGSSNAFLGGVNSYANEIKMRFLGVSEETLRTVGAVSRECAEEMVNGIADRAKADAAISVTGIAGPGGATPGKPVGLVYIGVRLHTKTVVLECHFRGGRDQVRERTAAKALNTLRSMLLESAE